MSEILPSVEATNHTVTIEPLNKASITSEKLQSKIPQRHWTLSIPVYLLSNSHEVPINSCRMSLAIRTATSGRSATAAALIDDVSAKRMVVLSLKEKLESHKAEEVHMTSDLRSHMMNETELGHDILDLRAFVKDDPNDKKAKKKLAKLEAKLQIELHLAIAKRTGHKAAIAATNEDLTHAEAALRAAVEAKLAYRRQLLAGDSSSEESSDEESEVDDDDDGTKGATLGNFDNDIGGGVDIEVAPSLARASDTVPVSGIIDLSVSLDCSNGSENLDAKAAQAGEAASYAVRNGPSGTRRSGRAVAQPVSYEEPSLNAKVRKGHQFFPK